MLASEPVRLRHANVYVGYVCSRLSSQVSLSMYPWVIHRLQVTSLQCLSAYRVPLG